MSGEVRASVEIRQRPFRERPSAPPDLYNDHAVVELTPAAWASISREGGTATLYSDRIWSPSLLAHPFLGLVGAVMGWWAGRDTLHAGVIGLDGAAWGVLGAKGAGKSTFLAMWLAAGGEVVADDLLVTSDRSACSAPRSLDLRRAAADRLGLSGESVRGRVRLRLPPVADRVPLAGLLVLKWGDAGVGAVPPSQRIEVLAEHAITTVPARRTGLLELATLPMWELRRPKRWEAARDAVGAAQALLRD